MTFDRRKPTLARAPALALCLAVAALPAAAQDAAQDTAQDTGQDMAPGGGLHLGRILVGTTGDGTPVHAGENTTVIEGDSVTLQGGTARIDDVLRQTPGVSSRIDPGNPGVAVAIRGFQGQGRVAMRLDGVPQTFRFLGHTSEGYAYVPQGLLAGIDVTRGAVVTAGGGGLAGAVDFRLLRPGDVVAGEGFGGLARLSFGSNGKDFTRTLAAGHVGRDLSLLVALTANGSDPFEDGSGAIIANSQRDSAAAMVRGEWRIDDRQAVEILGTRQRYDFAANSYDQELTGDLLKLGYRLDLGGPADLRVNLYRARTETEYLDTIATGAPGASTGRVMETTTTGIDLTHVGRATLGGWDLTSSNGFEIIRDRLDGTNTGVNPSVGSARQVALFSENLFSRGRWEFAAAARVTDYRLSGDYDGSGTGAFPAGRADIDTTAVDPKLTLAYRATDGLQPYASVFRTTRMPSLQETLQDSYHPIGPAFAFYLGPNPGLGPEQATGAEIGANLDRGDVLAAGDRLTARLAVFRMNVKDYVAQVDNGPQPPFFMPSLYWYDNIPGTTVSQGLELEASYESDRLSAALSYTNARSTPSAGSEGFSLQPERTVSATLARHFRDGVLTVGATYSHTSGGRSLDSGQDSGGYGLWDVFARYDVTDSFRVTAKIANLGNVDYAPWGATGKGPGRSAYLGADIRF